MHSHTNQICVGMQVDVPLINHMFANNSAESFLSDNADTESIIPRRLGTSKGFNWHWLLYTGFFLMGHLPL